MHTTKKAEAKKEKSHYSVSVIAIAAQTPPR
jgi:hypothetical protein